MAWSLLHQRSPPLSCVYFGLFRMRSSTDRRQAPQAVCRRRAARRGETLHKERRTRGAGTRGGGFKPPCPFGVRGKPCGVGRRKGFARCVSRGALKHLSYFMTHPGVALLWVPTFGGAPVRARGGCVFEERLGVGVIMRENLYRGDWAGCIGKSACVSVCLSVCLSVAKADCHFCSSASWRFEKMGAEQIFCYM